MSYTTLGFRSRFPMSGFGLSALGIDCNPGFTPNEDGTDCYCERPNVIDPGTDNCVDPSVLCGPGTQWIDQSKACEPLCTGGKVFVAGKGCVTPGGGGGGVVVKGGGVVVSKPPLVKASAMPYAIGAAVGIVALIALAAKKRAL